MKYQILHESSSRIRVRLCQPRMTLEQADLLEAWLQTVTGVQQAAGKRVRKFRLIRQIGRRAIVAILADICHIDALKTRLPDIQARIRQNIHLQTARRGNLNDLRPLGLPLRHRYPAQGIDLLRMANITAFQNSLHAKFLPISPFPFRSRGVPRKTILSSH